MQVKQTIVRVNKQKKIQQIDSRNIRSGQINSLVYSEKKECTGELSDIKRPGRPRRPKVVDDQRIFPR